jgi:hypothetical protein
MPDKDHEIDQSEKRNGKPLQDRIESGSEPIRRKQICLQNADLKVSKTETVSCF